MNNFQPKTLFIGKKCIYLPSCHSTNDIAAEIIQNKSDLDGTIVITDQQTSGRGQRGNSWESGYKQNIMISVILKPKFLEVKSQFKLNIAVSLAINEFLGKYVSENLKIKWPNDIYYRNQKLGGVLIENSLVGSRINHSIIGIGLNINQLDFQSEKAISLRKITNNEFDLIGLIEELCLFLEKYYLQLQNQKDFLQKKMYLESLLRFNEFHFFEKDNIKILGKIIDVEENGRLKMQVNHEILTFDFKEISFVF